jgi:hypothetical protein
MNSVPETDTSAPATIDCHFIEPLSPLNRPTIARHCGEKRENGPAANRESADRAGCYGHGTSAISPT